MHTSEAQFKTKMRIVGFDTPAIETIIKTAKETTMRTTSPLEWWLGSAAWLAYQGQTSVEIQAWLYGAGHHG